MAGPPIRYTDSESPSDFLSCSDVSGAATEEAPYPATKPRRRLRRRPPASAARAREGQ